MTKLNKWLKVGFTAAVMVLQPINYCISKGIMVVNPALGLALEVAGQVATFIRTALILVDAIQS